MGVAGGGEAGLRLRGEGAEDAVDPPGDVACAGEAGSPGEVAWDSWGPVKTAEPPVVVGCPTAGGGWMVGAVDAQVLRHWRQQLQSVQARPANLHSHAWRVARGMVRVQVD